MVPAGQTSDGELCALAVGGDRAAFAELLYRADRVVGYLASKYRIPGATREDVEQEARIGVWEAARTYDEDAGGAFATFARTVAERRVQDAITAQHRKKRVALNSARSLNAFLTPDSEVEMIDILPSPAAYEPPAIVERKEMLQRIGRLPARLSRREREVLAGQLNGLRYADMGDEKSVDNTVQRIRAKARVLLSEAA